ncbi:MAG TPA: hypothetical protein VFF04_01920 [Candidatus Babeliales bacterium]|nr:hypothetical protein [Candidatus Babeliales bacterium]
MNKLIVLSLLIASSILASSKEEKKIKSLSKGRVFLTLQIDTSKLNHRDFKDKGSLIIRVTSDQSVKGVIKTLTENLNQRSKSKGKSDYVPDDKTVILNSNGNVLSCKSTLASLIADHTLREVRTKKKKSQSTYCLDAHFYED